MADRHSNEPLDPTKSLYLYALTPEPFEAISGVTGVGETASVFVADVGGLGAALDLVDNADWVGEEAEAKMRSLDWVGPRAIRHEEVVAAATSHGQTFPVPFGTLFSGWDELEATLESYGGVIEDYFAATANCEEWSVKGVIDRDVVEAHLMGGDDGPVAGADYLRRRKQVQETRKQLEPWLNELVTPFWESLVEQTRDHRVLSTKVSRQASEEDVVFNWAFLVERDARADFEAAIDTFHATNVEKGVGLRLGGPWAPYSFRPSLPEQS